ncbi:MAG: hypothetical protein CMM52_11595 [Rhodospirillaceae bacterium]|nr:hypothetical protein [Rhodospirillaceae bacterium]|tara:strand:- start:3401 stop:4030 length:630 start_codon:yes stop_codon:yes gene_type:complete
MPRETDELGDFGMAFMKTSTSLSIVVLATALVTGHVSADTVQDQAAFDTKSYGWDSVAGLGNQQIADDFRLKHSGKISNLRWTGKYHDSSIPGETKFEVLIFADRNGTPGKLLHSENVSVTGWDTKVSDSGSHRMLSYNAELLSSPALKAGHVYWLTICESDPETQVRWSWSFHKSDISGGYSYRLGNSSRWALGKKDMAYALSVSRSQ